MAIKYIPPQSKLFLSPIDLKPNWNKFYFIDSPTRFRELKIELKPFDFVVRHVKLLSDSIRSEIQLKTIL